MRGFHLNIWQRAALVAGAVLIGLITFNDPAPEPDEIPVLAIVAAVVLAVVALSPKKQGD